MKRFLRYFYIKRKVGIHISLKTIRLFLFFITSLLVALIYADKLTLAEDLGTHSTASEQEFKLLLIYTGEELGNLEPCGCTEGQLGGLPRRDTFIKSLQRERFPPLKRGVRGDLGKQNFLLLDLGDIVAEASRQDELKYEISLTALKEMGYSAICVGEKDLLLGIDYLKYVQQSSSTPLLACNLVNQGKVIFSPYLLKTYKVDSTQLRVAVIGVISKAFEEFIKNADAVPSVKRPSANSLELLKPEVAIRLLIEQLENKADLIILLAHVSIEEAKGLASMFPQVNVIIAGHEQQVPLTKPLHEGDCIILNAGTEGKYVGKMEMIVASTGKRKVIVETNHQMIALTDKIPDSPLMTELMSLYQQMLEAEDLVHKVKKVSPDSEGTYVGSERCRSCHEEIYLEWEKSAHSHVYATLVKRKRNLDPECVQCHVTGFRYQTGFVDTQKTPALANVGCESCHGVGSNHVKNLKNGYGQTKKEICRTCHTPQKSPKFNYVEYLSKNSH